MYKLTLFLAMSFVITACNKAAPTKASKCSLFAEQLDEFSPIDRLSKNITEGRPVYLAVHGITLMFPGLEEFSYEEQLSITGKQGFDVIAGTSDMIDDEGCRNFQDRAINYAMEYNRQAIREFETSTP